MQENKKIYTAEELDAIEAEILRDRPWAGFFNFYFLLLRKRTVTICSLILALISVWEAEKFNTGFFVWIGLFIFLLGLYWDWKITPRSPDLQLTDADWVRLVVKGGTVGEIDKNAKPGVSLMKKNLYKMRYFLSFQLIGIIAMIALAFTTKDNPSHAPYLSLIAKAVFLSGLMRVGQNFAYDFGEGVFSENHSPAPTQASLFYTNDGNIFVKIISYLFNSGAILLFLFCLLALTLFFSTLNSVNYDAGLLLGSFFFSYFFLTGGKISYNLSYKAWPLMTYTYTYDKNKL